MSPRTLVVWRIVDGKPGHDNQSQGLVDALARQRLLSVHVIDAARSDCRETGTGQVPPPPSLIIGAGSATHKPMLRARRQHGGRTVVLMRPSVGLGRFDLCIIPAHDGVAASANILITEGALNAVRPDPSRPRGGNLILVGGPSRHHDWLDREIETQVKRIVAASAGERWTVCDSRRTPPSMAKCLAHIAGVKYAHWRQCEPGWLAEQLAVAGCVWVSEDSVSMVYEALTAGAAVGLLAVPRRRVSRVGKGVANLISKGAVTPFEMWAGSTLR